MANPFAGTPFIPSDNPELPQIMQRQRMAQMLLQQGQEPLQGQMVSGHYVAPSWTQGLAKGLQTYMGQKGLKESDEKMLELARQLRSQEQGDIQKFMELSQGKPARTIQPLTPNDDEGNPMPAAQVDAQASDMNAAYAALLSSQSPQLRQMGMQGSMSMAQKQAELAQGQQQRVKASQLWQSVGGDPQKFIMSGGDPNIAKQFAESPTLGKSKGVVVGDSLLDPYTAKVIGSANNPNKPFKADGTPNQAFQQWELQKAAASRAPMPAQPYFQPVQTAQGVMAFNARTGRMEPVQVGGAPVVGAQFDPNLQGTLAGAKESGKMMGEAQTQAKIDLPKVAAQGEETVKLVDDLLAAPGFKQAVGTSRVLGIQNIPGTAAKDFDIRLDQLKGKQFLQAFESLKGGGQITEVEGRKATDAISRMNAAASEAEFTKAAREFQDVIRQGVERAKGRAGGASGGPPAPKRMRFDAQGNVIP